MRTDRSLLKTVLFFVALVVVAFPAAGQGGAITHPRFPLLGDNFLNVLQSGAPVSTRRTCGMCHDTEYITSHSIHANGALGIGSSIAATVMNPPGASDIVATAEMNCFLCHIGNPANDRRIEAINSGSPEWAASATLANTPIVVRQGAQWSWNPGAFSANGNVRGAMFALTTPSTLNCALCHGIAADGLDDSVSPSRLGPGDRTTLTTGEIFSPQLISRSAANVAGKDTLTRSWDVHAEHLLECVDCHHSVNNPTYPQLRADTVIEGLKFDPRRLPFGEYLKRPNHNFAGQSDSLVEDGALHGLSCVNCHDAGPTHRWLPYADRHIDALSCEACHTPRLHFVAVQSVDWTSVNADGSPLILYRGAGIDGVVTAESQLRGFEPALLPRPDSDGRTRLAPYNLVTTWYWVAGDSGRPIAVEDLRALFDIADSGSTVLFAVFDADGNGEIDDAERQFDSSDKVAVVEERLGALGYVSPHIVGEIQPYAVFHGTTGSGWATRECRSCHQTDSRLTQPTVLSSSTPGGVAPALLGGAELELRGTTSTDETGQLVYEPEHGSAGLYVLGLDSVGWPNFLGLLSILGVLVAVIVHGTFRWLANRRRPTPTHGLRERVHMYSAYERFWHWLQALTISILMLTGLEIHFSFGGLFGFALAVQMHNIIALVVVANAVFAALFHFASGQIRHYLPVPAGFFEQAVAQARYYVYGIFHHEPHPFNKRPGRRLNALQQITYLVILNLLLPLQVVSGFLIWGAQRWSGVDAAMGGLSIVAPIHAFGAWMFGTFLLMHIYLTTTGNTPTTGIRAMALGWEEIDIQ